jgi:DNA-binding SARP family transcriptional activator
MAHIGAGARCTSWPFKACRDCWSSKQHAGVIEPAVQTGLRLLALDDLQEPVHRTMMQLYTRLGRREAALRQYRYASTR